MEIMLIGQNGDSVKIRRINSDIIKELHSVLCILCICMYIMYCSFDTALNKQVCLASCIIYVFVCCWKDAERRILCTRLKPNILVLNQLLV